MSKDTWIIILIGCVVASCIPVGHTSVPEFIPNQGTFIPILRIEQECSCPEPEPLPEPEPCYVSSPQTLPEQVGAWTIYRYKRGGVKFPKLE